MLYTYLGIAVDEDDDMHEVTEDDGGPGVRNVTHRMALPVHAAGCPKWLVRVMGPTCRSN